MSQVKRNIPMMQGGGAAPGQQAQASTPKTYGKFIMNGQEEEVTEDLINQFSSWLSSQSRDVQTSLAGVRQQLQAGQDVNFDSHSQELSDNAALPLRNERQNRRMRKQRSGMGMLFDALTNNQVHKNAVAMEALSGFRYNKPTPEAPQPTTVNFSRYDVDYNPTEDGKSRTFSANPANSAAWNRIQKFINYRNMDEEGRKAWNLTGFNGLSLQEMLDNTQDDAITGAWSRVTNNSATADDWDILNRFNIFEPGSDQQGTAAPATPEQRQKQMEDAIFDHGLDIEQANRYGIGLNEDLSLDLSRLDRNKVYLFSDYGPVTKGKYYGGAYYNGQLYTKEEAEQNQDLINLLAPYREQVSRGVYNDTATVVHNWGRPVASEVYDPTKEYFAPFHDILQPVNGRNRRYTWLNQGYDVDALEAGEHMISVEDTESGTNPLTGYANKLKYYLYSPQTGITSDYAPIRQLRESLDANQTYSKPAWGNRYKGGQRYAPIADRDGYKFYVGEDDGAWYVERGGDGDYFLVQDLDVAKRIMDGKGVNEDEITRMLKGKTTVFGGRSAIGKLLRDDSGIRNVRGSLRNIGGPSQQQWAVYLNNLSNERGTVLGNNADGTPRRYQYGGALRNIQRVQANRQAESKPLAVSIRDPRQPKVIGDGRGLNGNDKLELASMAADLAGLGLSFVPGAGNIAGGVAGVAGTGMQFAADVSRDGLDWGDVGRGALNLGLDVLSFIPALGSAAKAGKVVRNIRRIGNTVLKALAVGGAGNAAVTAAQKILSGDKWTMDDLRIVVAGLQGGTAVGRSVSTQARAGRQWQNIQNRNIAAKNKGISEGGVTTKKATLKGLEETTITKGKGKKAKTTTGTKEVNKDLELKFNEADIKKFNTLKGESAKNEFLAGKLKTDHNFTPTPEQTSSLMEAFALPKDKALTLKGKSITTQRGKLKGETKTPTLTKRQAYKQVSRSYSPRNTATRNSAIEATQPFINRDAMIRASKNPLAGPRSMWEVGQSPWRTLQVTRSGEDSNQSLQRYDTWQNQYRELKKGGTIPKYQPGGRTRRLEDMNAINDWGNTLSSFGQRTFSQSDLDILNAQHSARVGMGNAQRGSAVGNFQSTFNNPLLSSIIGHVAGTDGYGQTAKGAYNAAQNGTYNVDNRLGGVTRSWIAGSEALQNYFGDPNNTGNSSNVRFDPNANNGNGGYVFRNSSSVGVDENGNPIQTVALDPITVTAQRNSRPNMEVGAPITKPTPGTTGLSSQATAATTSNEKEQKGQTGFGRFIGGFKNLPKIGFDPDNAMALGGLAMAIGQNNRQARVMKQGINTAMGALESAPQEVYPRFTDYGVNAAYENAAQQQLGVKPATSDYLMSHAIEQDSKNKAEQLRLEGRLKTSELYSNYLNTTDSLRRDYAGMRTDVTNRNRQRMAQLNMANAETEAGRLANNYTSANNFLMEKRNRLAQDKVKHENYNNALLRSQLAQDQQTAYANALQPHQARFNALSPEEQAKYRGPEDWLQKTDVASYQLLQNEFNKLNEDRFAEYGNQQLDYYTVGNKYPGLSGFNNVFSIFPTRPRTRTRTMAKGGKTKSRTLNAAEQIWINQNKDVADAVKQLNKNVIQLFIKATT